MKLPFKSFWVRDDKEPNSFWEGDWIYPTPKNFQKEKEVIVVEPLELQLFIEQKITEGYREGFSDAVKAMPIVKVASNSWEIKG